MPTTDDDPAGAASDALSLHTIADQADAYAAQEAEDADFALALSLEDEERQNLLQAQVRRAPDALPPYPDEPNAGVDSEDHLESLPPYRDDPDALPTSDEENAAPARRRDYAQLLRKLVKAWLCYIAIAPFVATFIVGVVIIAILAFRTSKPNPKGVAFRASGSQDYNLKLTKLYPTLEEGAHADCHRIWSRYASTLRCHRMILSPAWDSGNVSEVEMAGADPYAYSEAVCTKSCRSSIRSLDNTMHNGCYRRTDRFNLTTYGLDGDVYFEKDKVEEGPMHVYKSLIERYDRLCAEPPKEKKSEWGTCAADLWMRWGIVDGKNEAHMNGLDKFYEKTDTKKTIEGGRKTGSVAIIGGKKEYDVQVPARNVGPGFGETECGYCALDWLERKMKSFEYGQILDPDAHAVSLTSFSRMTEVALSRCESNESKKVLRRVRDRWSKFGWWCGRAPCPNQPEITDEVKEVLHGVPKKEKLLAEVHRLMNDYPAQKNAIETFYDGIFSMPCSVAFPPDFALRNIVPYQHVVNYLCGDRCRNAIDRLQQQHGKEWYAASTAMPGGLPFSAWDFAREQVNRTCLNPYPLSVVQGKTSFCAPGYAALGHPEWIFADTPPSKATVLSTFAEKVKDLEKNPWKVPHYVPTPKPDADFLAIIGRTVSESICNGCAGELLIGRNPDWKKRVQEFLEDEDVDSAEYRKVAKMYWQTCTQMIGQHVPRLEWDRIWKDVGLDR